MRIRISVTARFDSSGSYRARVRFMLMLMFRVRVRVRNRVRVRVKVRNRVRVRVAAGPTQMALTVILKVAHFPRNLRGSEWSCLEAESGLTLTLTLTRMVNQNQSNMLSAPCLACQA